MKPVKKIFKKHAQKKHRKAAFDFENEIAQVWRDFPDVREKIIFFDASAGAKMVYPDGFDGKEEAQKLADQYGGPAKMESAFKSFGGKNSFCQPISGGRRLLYLLMEKHSHDLVDRKAPVAQETTFVFDHELGHAIVSGGVGFDKNKAECTADAYATIRHLQRYGADSPAINAIVANRSFDLVFREGWYGSSHFTSPVTQKILDCRHRIDWDSLTPEQTVKMAQKFVLEHEMSVEARAALSKDFKDLSGKAKDIEAGDITPLRELADKVLSTNSADVLKYGSAALELCIDQQTAGLILKGEYWDKVRQKLAEKQESFAKQRPLSDLPPPPARYKIR